VKINARSCQEAEICPELEHSLASTKEDAKQKDIERKLFVQKMEAENRKLRASLTFLGMRPSDIETYLHMGDNSIIGKTQEILLKPSRRLSYIIQMKLVRAQQLLVAKKRPICV
jgi:hypothetical protein